MNDKSGWIIQKSFMDDILLFVLWITFAIIVYLLSFPISDPMFALPYIVFILYYTRLYWRLLIVPIWTENTLTLLQDSVKNDYLKKCIEINNRENSELPGFIVLIAAYKAAGSIGTVLTALDKQKYPENKYEAYVMTHQVENDEKWRNFDTLQEKILRILQSPKTFPVSSQLEIKILNELFALSLQKTGEEKELITLTAAHLCFNNRKYLIADKLVKAMIFKFFHQYHMEKPLGDIISRFNELGVSLNKTEIKFMAFAAKKSFQASHRIIGDFSKVLGLENGHTIFRDSHKPLKLSFSLTRESFLVSLSIYYLRRRLRKRLVNFIPTVENELFKMLKKVFELSDLPGKIKKIYDRLQRTCPETVQENIESINRSGFHHICRKEPGVGKPEALNAGYFHILGKNLHGIPENTYFLVIDADSLLHSSTLAATAYEILKDSDRNVIRQIAPLSTANFYGNNAYVKLICCLDSIGSMGKWAQNIRAQKRPDLPAGSGVLIPSTLLEYFQRTKGKPWETETITEDARMIITDYGLLDGASKKTKFIPVYLLEAVPEAESIFKTYQQYWVQRMRWASGGPNEAIQLFKAFTNNKLYFKSNTDNGEVISYKPSFLEKVKARFNQAKLLYYWINDHLWWGFGFGLAPIIWLIFAFFFLLPPFFKPFGLFLFLGAPTFVVFRAFRKFAKFIPGGLNFHTLLRLFLATVFMAWFQTLPIIYTQILYLLGNRKRFRKWTTSSKPQF